MIHAEPIVRTLGDACVTVEFADTMDLAQNMRVQALAQLLESMELRGVVEVVPNLRTLAVTLDRRLTTPARVRAAVAEALGGVTAIERMSSRLFRLPVWYDDPWSAEIAQRYEVEDNLAFVAGHNGLSKDEAIAAHSGTDQWVAAVGFVPGCFWTVALEQDKVLSAPKYRVPRDRTPSRAVALAGITTTIYPYPGPGGYQCIGRCAVEVYDLAARDPLFGADGVLVRPGDRHRYVPVDPFAYEELREAVRAGTYEYDVTEETLDVREWIAGASSDD